MRFEWDARKAKANLRKHGVSFEEAETAFQDPHAQLWLDSGHTAFEDRYQLLAHSQRRELILLIVHTYPADDSVRIISARKASKSERDVYFEG